MEEYIRKATDKTPGIHLKDGLVAINGRSIPEDPNKIFKSAHQWVKDYVKKPANHTDVNIQIEYCDTGSTINIFNILTKLVKCRNSNYHIEMIFNWFYEKDDEEILELGKFMESKLNVMFNYIEMQDERHQGADEIPY
jgi:hypothetical protein